MIPVEELLAFSAASVLLGLAPGPDNLFVLTQSALYGARAGLQVVLGLCTGLLVHTALVALGVAALLLASPLAFALLRLAGALYLLYLAWQSFTAAAAPVPAGGQSSLLSGGQLYRRGIIMNLTNPKVSLFFLAFLPQFVAPEYGRVDLQVGLLGALFILATLLVFGAVALMAGRLGEWLSRSVRTQRWLHRLAGGVFVLLALRLLLIDP
ncbi:LysE family translocator [Thiohalobacter thiocyanaticus]|uniref:LysE family translocator n=1 Tax=Thiohalobacter thiocyanaticus TaxID=585455 RepID=A0A426QLK0_9GAMM|nr:LysE family translocator [Thiohalobacter thiocyanaticus]RRQ22641.1 LysE family translocator [Thiohalobacter thiocyanaticus]